MIGTTPERLSQSRPLVPRPLFHRQKVVRPYAERNHTHGNIRFPAEVWRTYQDLAELYNMTTTQWARQALARAARWEKDKLRKQVERIINGPVLPGDEELLALHRRLKGSRNE